MKNISEPLPKESIALRDDATLEKFQISTKIIDFLWLTLLKMFQ